MGQDHLIHIDDNTCLSEHRLVQDGKNQMRSSITSRRPELEV